MSCQILKIYTECPCNKKGPTDRFGKRKSFCFSDTNIVSCRFHISMHLSFLRKSHIFLVQRKRRGRKRKGRRRKSGKAEGWWRRRVIKLRPLHWRIISDFLLLSSDYYSTKECASFTRGFIFGKRKVRKKDTSLGQPRDTGPSPSPFSRISRFRHFSRSRSTLHSFQGKSARTRAVSSRRHQRINESPLSPRDMH